MQVLYQVYKSDKESSLSSQQNLIIVSADKSQTSHWRSTLTDLTHHCGKKIARIILDEAHIPLISKSYRESLKHFYNIRSEPVQLVLLSATLPPAIMPQLSTTYHLLADTTIFRLGTNRPELQYVLEKMTTESDAELTIRA
jgi:superfamily II DNA helicase RecQ